jgi:DDE superfamily endonuclease
MASGHHFLKPHTTYYFRKTLSDRMFEDIALPELQGSHGALVVMLLFLIFAYDVIIFDSDERNPPEQEQRLNWAEHCLRSERRGTFHRMYRISPDSFARLAVLLEGAMTANRHDVRGPIIPKVRLHCVIRYLAGGSYLDICAIAGIHTSTFYYVLWKTCDALNSIEELAFHLPRTPQELANASAGFESISTNGIMHGCIGVVDGWLCPIEVPPSRSVGNVTSFFSGHYQRYGLNVQAVTDHLGRFMYMAAAEPGSAPDINAFKRTMLPQILAALPLGYFIIGDCAYPPSEHLVPVFGGTSRLNADNDNCNYYLSQCRIRVEMAFGMMTNRFGLLRSPLRVNPAHVRVLMQTIARLHNYCLNENNNYEVAAYSMAANAGDGRVMCTMPKRQAVVLFPDVNYET